MTTKIRFMTEKIRNPGSLHDCHPPQEHTEQLVDPQFNGSLVVGKFSDHEVRCYCCGNRSMFRCCRFDEGLMRAAESKMHTKQFLQCPVLYITWV